MITYCGAEYIVLLSSFCGIISLWMSRKSRDNHLVRVCYKDIITTLSGVYKYSVTIICNCTPETTIYATKGIGMN